MGDVDGTAGRVVDQARREYVAALGREVEAKRQRMAAGSRLFSARRALYVQRVAQLAAGADRDDIPVPCRTCLRDVPTTDDRHELIAEAGGLLYARCERP